MTLLIVDDEDLTRQGLKAAIEGMDLPINEIFEADDGLKGTECAKEKRPDLILSDIRMAKMSGIDMVDSLKDILPEAGFIFMSGYSDREYLKAAIRLKAVNFIEKPIDLKELKAALKEAIQLIEEKKRTIQSKLFHSKAAAGRLALTLTLPPEEAGEISDDVIQNALPGLKKNGHFTTYIVKSTTSLDNIDENERIRINTEFDGALLSLHCQEINIEKHDRYLVYHVYSPDKPDRKKIQRIGETLKNIIGTGISFFISIGDTVSGMENTYRSYNQAVLLMQTSFFHDYGSIITEEGERLPAPQVLPDPSDAYLLALMTGDLEKIGKTERQIEESLSDSRNLLPDQVRDIYYRLFTCIFEACRKLSISPSFAIDTSESLLSFVQECNTLRELSNALSEKSKELALSMTKNDPENPTVLSIKEYIDRNYSRENLSVKEISDYVHMSSTYVCTLFKGETGVTLNQYITGFRMEKAKELLSDPKYRISDVSVRVGYPDGNYFGKSFKKAVGMTPSEYRDRVML